jgi:hypothetical protein
MLSKCQYRKTGPRPERLIKIISTRYFLVIKEFNKYLVDMILIYYFRSGPKTRHFMRPSWLFLLKPPI